MSATSKLRAGLKRSSAATPTTKVLKASELKKGRIKPKVTHTPKRTGNRIVKMGR